MLKSDFNYNLPQELIAQTPIYPRDQSRLLTYNRANESIEHHKFCDIYDILQKGDVLVINNTRVIYARIFATDATNRQFELLLLKRIDYTHWEAIIKSAKKAKIGNSLVVNEELSLKICDVIDNGVRIIEFSFDGIFEDILYRVGNIPLPPYITEELKDKERYQTVYSKVDGSSAAPTAGLHFTQELMTKLKAKGIEIIEVLLHVGLGTFRPVKVDDILDHNMHHEYYEISQQAAVAINRAKSEGRRVIAVGTTSVRALESASTEKNKIVSGSGDTNIFIYPPYQFKIVDALITNFHLPESTLIMLVSALCSREKTLELYNLAVAEKYRFFSFGDAMLIL